MRQAVLNHRETAALLYNLLCQLAYGNQLDKVRGLLNNIPGKETCVCKVIPQADGVEAYSIDGEYIVTYQASVKAVFNSHQEAAKVSEGLVAKLTAERERKEAEYEKLKKDIKVDCRKLDNIPYICLTTASRKPVNVLLDKDKWEDIYVQKAKLYLTQNSQVVIWPLGKQMLFLLQWLHLPPLAMWLTIVMTSSTITRWQIFALSTI